MICQYACILLYLVAGAYACKCAQARKHDYKCLIKQLKIMEQQQKMKPEDYTQPTVTKNVKINEVTEKEPFLIIDREGEFMIALGNKIVSREKFKSREAAEAYIDSKPWYLIFNATAVMFENLQKYRNELQNEQ